MTFPRSIASICAVLRMAAACSAGPPRDVVGSWSGSWGNIAEAGSVNACNGSEAYFKVSQSGILTTSIGGGVCGSTFASLTGWYSSTSGRWIGFAYAGDDNGRNLVTAEFTLTVSGDSATGTYEVPATGEHGSISLQRERR